MRELTLKQRLFVEAFVGEAEGIATRAAVIAGYSSTYGCKLLKLEHIQAAIGEEAEELDERLALTRDRIHELWMMIAEDEGESTKDRLAALRDAARAQGMFLDRVELSGEVEVPVRVVLPSNGRERD